MGDSLKQFQDEMANDGGERYLGSLTADSVHEFIEEMEESHPEFAAVLGHVAKRAPIAPATSVLLACMLARYYFGERHA